MSAPAQVFVEAAARLHFGVLDLRGSLGRWFGGIGAAASAPTLLVSARRSDELAAAGQDAERALRFARRFLDHYGLPGGADVRVERALPSHAGLGSGTQLALSVSQFAAANIGFVLLALVVATLLLREYRRITGAGVEPARSSTQLAEAKM